MASQDSARRATSPGCLSGSRCSGSRVGMGRSPSRRPDPRVALWLRATQISQTGVTSLYRRSSSIPPENWCDGRSLSRSRNPHTRLACGWFSLGGPEASAPPTHRDRESEQTLFSAGRVGSTAGRRRDSASGQLYREVHRAVVPTPPRTCVNLSP